MKDGELRGLVLKAIYDRRRMGIVPFDGLQLQLIEADTRRALTQLEEKGLIEWLGKPVGQLGLGRITAYGTEVVEGEASAPFSITIDSSVNVSGSSGVQIGQGNIQHVNLDVEKLIAAVDHSRISETEKTEAKSLLKKLWENKIVRGVIEGWVKSHTGGPA